MKVLNQELTNEQYLALLSLAKRIPDWNTKTKEYQIEVIMGIKVFK